MAMPGTETIRFRRPTAGPNAIAAKKKKAEEEIKVDKFGGKHAPAPAWKRRHLGLLQDQVGRQSNGIFIPNFSVALRLLLLVRVGAAMYSNIQDCDEVFNFFEPLHYFLKNSGFQTWELSPEFALRSWFYVLLHAPAAVLVPWVFSISKRTGFFMVRITLGIVCSFCEAAFFRAVAAQLNERVGRYLLFALLSSAGMWNASTAFLPSSFAMYTTMLAYAFWMKPTDSNFSSADRRVYLTTAAFALGAIVGWPFSLLLAVPFVIEQMFVYAGDIVTKDRATWQMGRMTRLAGAGLAAALIAIPVVIVDSYAYGRWTFPTWNIIRYNLFSSGGPDLYGTEPTYFYVLNLFLNFNILSLLALASLPALAITYVFDFRRLGASQRSPKAGESSPYTLVALRLSGFYLWFLVLSAQAHKEERFMFPAYPLLCMNAAVTVFLFRGWMERVYIKITASPYEAGRSKIFGRITLVFALIPAILSISRMYALGQFYHAPLDLAYHFQYTEIPEILIAAGYKPKVVPEEYLESRERDGYNDEWDFTVLENFEDKVRLCYGKEWYRFPGSFLIPEGVEIRFLRTEGSAMMPRNWEPSKNSTGLWPREETRVVRPGRFNQLNMESMEPGTFVEPETCTFIVDSSLPSNPPSKLEPSYVDDPNWEVRQCFPFLDAPSSDQWARSFWIPAQVVKHAQVWGKYCLVKNTKAPTPA